MGRTVCADFVVRGGDLAATSSVTASPCHLPLGKGKALARSEKQCFLTGRGKDGGLCCRLQDLSQVTKWL